MIKLHVMLVLLGSLLIGCTGGGETDSNQTEPGAEKTTEEPEVESAAVNEDLLPGLLEVSIKGEDFSITEFDKHRSEITYTDKGTMVRLTTLDKERSIQFLFQNIDLNAPKPFDVSLDIQKEDKAGYTLQGFLGSKNDGSSTMIIDGTTTISTFDEGSRMFEANFEGTAFHQQLMNKIKDTVQVEGKVKVQLDHDLDTRKK